MSISKKISLFSLLTIAILSLSFNPKSIVSAIGAPTLLSPYDGKMISDPAGKTNVDTVVVTVTEVIIPEFSDLVLFIFTLLSASIMAFIFKRKT